MNSAVKKSKNDWMQREVEAGMPFRGSHWKFLRELQRGKAGLRPGQGLLGRSRPVRMWSQL